MNSKQAIQELLFQSARHSDIENPRWKNGFLGMLRPFKGELNERNFHKIIEALYILSDDFSRKEIKNDMISSIWGICHLSREWAIRPNGMLQSNNLITPEQTELIESWIDHISYITFSLLDGCKKETAFEFYHFDYENHIK